MNKLKFLYDVVNVMKEQENWQGGLQVEVVKDQAEILMLQAQFSKNLATGEGKSQIKTEYDCDGKKVKHESNTEFTMQGECGFHERIHHKLKEHWQCRFRQGAAVNKCCGLKDKLNRIALLLQLLGSFKLEEKQDRSFQLSINSADFSPELQQALLEKLTQHRELAKQHFEGDQACCCGLLRHLAVMEKHSLEFKAIVKPNYAISKLVLICKGNGDDEDNGPFDLNLKAELDLI